MKKEKHITIRLEEEELEQIDNRASQEGVTRSEYIRMTLFLSELESVTLEL